MAVRRRPITVMPPPELFVYNPLDWPGVYPDSFEAWCTARREWVKTHGPDTALGNMLNVLRGDRRARYEFKGWKL
jgi:hypothetical protein